jgi:hypothetical protein
MTQAWSPARSPDANAVRGAHPVPIPSGDLVKLPVNFYKPLAIGAPAPFRALPVRPERVIHFFPPHVEKIRARVPEMIRQVDVLCGNLEDAIPVEDKDAARRRLHRGGERQRLRHDGALGARELSQLAVDPR